MSLLKKNLITLLLVAVVYLWFFFSHTNTTQQPPVKVLGADTNISLFVEPSAGRAPIVDAINSAKSEVLVEVYLLSDKEIIGALTQAKTRGVSVDVMLEEHPFGGGSLNNTTTKTLSDAGISVEWANSAFALTHEKAIVIDGLEAFILNQNLTGTSFSKNREYDVIDTNPQDVIEIRTIFVDDWQRKSFSQTSPNLVISPNTSRSLLSNLIQSGAKEIDIEIEDINDKQIVSILSNKAKNVQVKLIVPTISQVSSNADSIKELAKEGVLVKTLSSPYIHAKLILVDSQKAYVGSVNLSTQSMDENRELGIILVKNDSIETLAVSFASDWNKGSDFKN